MTTTAQPSAGEVRALATGAREAPTRRFLRRFARRRVAVLAALFLLLVVLTSMAAPLIAPQDLNEQSLLDRRAGPSSQFLLGADDLGRDQLTRLLYAGRASLRAALQATSLALLLGVPLGLVAGYRRRLFDAVVSRGSEAVQVIPPILLALAFVAIFGRGLTQAMIAAGLVFVPRVFRITRAATIAASEETYVEAARSVGGSTAHVLGRHVLPTISSPLLVEAAYLMSLALLVEAALAFLGLSTQPPDTSWGDMLARGIRGLEAAPHLVLVPGTMIFLAVLSFNALGDGVRSALGREVREDR